MPSREPIAIVGIGCRFPGAPDVESFWRVLRDGIETVGDYPGQRFDYIDRTFSSESVKRGMIATCRGGFLHDLDRFDAEFFGISPREAALLDPQQRLLLEVAWEAVEDAGIPAGELSGTKTGVFVGLWTSDYEHCIYEHSHDSDFYATTGGGRYPASGRLAYSLDLRGPNFTVDTACSSSLVAIHLACASLRRGESEMALAGGANVILRPEITLSYSAAKMLSPEGRCKFGDAAADGYVRSEGAGMVFLKSLSRAVADGDSIYAVIRGSAVNNDGRSSGSLISPSREGQEDMLRTALRDAGVPPQDVDYIEAHGTGTLAGDPVEIEAISAVVAEGLRKRPCLVGSVKTNLGHTESAAGVAGLIKVALSLERRTIPASLHFREPNQRIDWKKNVVAVQTKTTSWTANAESPIAGVSGFGITGTNAHVVLQGAPVLAPNREARDGSHLFFLSACTSAALQARAASWRDRLLADPAWPTSLSDLAYTAGVRRAHHDFRLALVASTRQELLDRLNGWLAKREQAGVRSGKRIAEEKRRAVFVFSGQDGQWLGMGRTLLRDEPAFREALVRCDEAIHKYTGWSVTERLTRSDAESSLNRVDVVQPVLFAMMVALAALWRSLGVEPEAVVGHSMGEAAAAAVCGALSLDEAAAVTCRQSGLILKASGRGLMAVAKLSPEDSEKFIRDYAGRILVAGTNSPTSTILSGDADAVEDALTELADREIFCRRIKTDVASHCAHMDPFREELALALKDIRPQKGSIPLYSTTSGAVEDGAGLNANYWSRNLRQPVLFSSAIQALLRDGFDTFIEVNPHPLLSQAIEDGIRHAQKDAVAVPSLRRDKDERAEMLDALGALHVSGFPIDLDRLYPQGTCLRLPPYPWQRERHWIQGDAQLASRGGGTTAQEPESAAGLMDISGIRFERAVEPTLAENIYELHWIPAEQPPRIPATKNSWILFGDSGGMTTQLASRLQTSGHSCLCVSDPDRMQQALESLGASCQGVVCIPRAIGADPQYSTEETFLVVRLVQAVVTDKLAHTPRLWLLTTGAWNLPADSSEVAVSQGSLWGLGRVIGAEYPELRPVNVDFSFSPTPDEFETFSSLLSQDGPEEQIAIRGRGHFVARFDRTRCVESAESPHFKSDGTYLITGGLGGIALKVAEWSIKLGARHIALVSRRGPLDPAAEHTKNLKSAGAAVRIFSADVADPGQLKSVLQAIEKEMPPLRGVFHMAAVMDGALLTDVTEERLDRVMRPKAVGAWNLHCQLQNTPLDFFILFSSIAAVMGQPGLATYASANAFLDSLARYRQAKGLKAQSIQWVTWADIGLATDEKVQRGTRVYRQQGIRSLALGPALDALAQVMSHNGASKFVLPIRWDEFARSFAGAAVPRAFATLVPQDAGTAKAAPTQGTIHEALLAAAPGGPRRGVLEAHLQEVLAGVLKTSASRLDLVKPLGSMGVDSLMALQFMRRLAATTLVQFPPTAVFNYPTLRLLGAEIARRMGISLDAAIQPASVSQVAPNLPTESFDVVNLTEEETIQALLQGGGAR